MPQNAINDDLLNQLGEEFAQQMRSGQSPSIDEFVRRHPDHAEDVRDFLESIEMLEDMKPTSKDPTSQSPPRHFGRYTIERTLGEGGMGAVYLAHDSQLDRKVAIKVPKFKENSDSTLMERFYREARSAATLQHPNLCPVYDVGELDGIHYISMAFIEGRPLSDYIKASKAPPINSILRIIRKVALALQEAHDHGVIHRDLKPANIMISRRNNEPIVMDFGLARQFDEVDDSTGNAVDIDPEQTVEARLTQHGTLLGSPGYMAPEQLQGQNSGPASDIYALGVLMYELLTQQLPFPGNGTLVSVVSSVLADPPPDASKIRSEVDPAIVRIVRKAMAKKVRDRFESMQTLAMALTRVLKAGSSSSSSQDSELASKDEAESPELVRTREQFELARSLYQEKQFAAAVSILEKMSSDSGSNRYTEWAREQLPKARAKAQAAAEVSVAEEYPDDAEYWTQEFDSTTTLAQSPSSRKDRVRDRRRKRQRKQKIKSGMAMAVGAAIVLLAAAVAKEVFFSGNGDVLQPGAVGGRGGRITGPGGQGGNRAPRPRQGAPNPGDTATPGKAHQHVPNGDGTSRPVLESGQPAWRKTYELLMSLDTNNDRKLTMEELRATSLGDPIIGRAMREFIRFDRTKDQALDPFELEFLVRPPSQQSGPGDRGPGRRGGGPGSQNVPGQNGAGQNGAGQNGAGQNGGGQGPGGARFPPGGPQGQSGRPRAQGAKTPGTSSTSP